MNALALATIETFKDQILHCDAETLLRSLPAGSVDCVVTSPPYDNLRQYGGFSWNFEAIAHLAYRALKPGGVMVWVVGDETIGGSETLTSFKQALYFREQVGFKVWDTMIYSKNGAIMNNHHPRYIDSWEFMFVLLRGDKPRAWNPVMRMNSTVGQKSGAKKRQRNGELKYFHNVRTATGAQSLEWNVWRIHSGGGQSARDKNAHKHPAIFPEELARRHVQTWTNPGDVVLDFFMGSGTTAAVSAQMRRHYIGCDLNHEYVEMARARLRNADPYQQSVIEVGGEGEDKITVTQASLFDVTK